MYVNDMANRESSIVVIYEAINRITHKRYIGQTKDFKQRKRQHKESIKYKNGCTLFKRAIKKYGFDSFEWKIIDYAYTQDELNQKESFWIKFFNTTDHRYGYNLKGGGYNPFLTDNVKKSIGEAQLGEKNHMFGKYGKDNGNSKRVIDINTQVTYDSVSSLCRENPQFSLSKVCAVCRGGRQSHKGHVFRYLDADDNIIQVSSLMSIEDVKKHKSNVYAKNCYSVKVHDITNDIIYNSMCSAVGRKNLSNFSRKLHLHNGKCIYHNIEWETIEN